MSALVRTGLVPNSYLLTTRGRKSGKRRRNPVTLVERDGRRWLVAPYGVVPWVRNARASGEVEVTRRWDTRRYRIREVGPEEAGPILKQYLAIASVPRPYFTADKDAAVEDFIAEAGKHPVFELLPA